MLAAVYDEDVVSQSVGRNWAHRAYFHGGVDELKPFPRPPPQVTHITETHLSPVFISSTTKKLKVAISTPIVREAENGGEEFVGILVMTVNLGDFSFFRINNAQGRDRFAVLVDGRPGPEAGTILLHPLLGDLVAAGGTVTDELRNLRVPRAVLEEELRRDSGQIYEDPLSHHAAGQAFAKRWIAAAAPVELLTGENRSGERSGLIVLVQESLDAVIEPVHRLGNQLLREGLSALGVVVAVAVAMWYFVSRFLVPAPPVGGTEKVTVTPSAPRGE
jgi:hypothetical protein